MTIISSLSRKDLMQLQLWLQNKVSLAEVESTSSIGLVENERFTASAKRAYLFLWSWSAPRFAGHAGLQQERIYQRFGYQALERRYARVNRIIDRICCGQIAFTPQPLAA